MYFLFSDRDLKPENILLDHKVSDLCVLYNVVGITLVLKALKLAKKDSFYIRFKSIIGPVSRFLCPLMKVKVTFL